MSDSQMDLFNKLVHSTKSLTEEYSNYWLQYSSFYTWEFWLFIFIVISMLTLLYFLIDRQRIFLIGFFGFATHVIFAYTDITGMRLGLWGYPYHIIPFLPSLSLDAAIIPISIMLVFQWVYRNQKNYYIYAFLTALFFGFVFKPILSSLNFFLKYEPITYFMIFLIYLVLFYIPYWLTKGFLWLQNHSQMEVNQMPREGRDTHKETTTHPDGFKEGVMNDSTGVQYGIEVSDEKIVNPADVAKMVNNKEDRNNK